MTIGSNELRFKQHGNMPAQISFAAEANIKAAPISVAGSLVVLEKRCPLGTPLLRGGIWRICRSETGTNAEDPLPPRVMNLSFITPRFTVEINVTQPGLGNGGETVCHGLLRIFDYKKLPPQ